MCSSDDGAHQSNVENVDPVRGWMDLGLEPQPMLAAGRG